MVGCFATSYVTDDGSVKHSLVMYSEQGLSTPGDNRFYATLDDFIDASRMMFFGLPRSNVNIDDNLLQRLNIREAHPMELRNGLGQAGAAWQQ